MVGANAEALDARARRRAAIFMVDIYSSLYGEYFTTGYSFREGLLLNAEIGIAVDAPAKERESCLHGESASATEK